MMKQRIKLIIVFLAAAAALAALWNFRSNSAADWQSQVAPGGLSAAHAHLENNCAACHTPVKGVADVNCISCHANNEALLQRQPTAFHANIGNCAKCHIEHQGVNANLRALKHETLALIGVKLSPEGGAVNHQTNPALPEGHRLVTPLEARLDCASCHSTKDRHQGLFGKSCAQCHATAQWTIPAFQHPSPRSTSCAQCHQAPPSHYMMHFEMVSKRVAGVRDAQVNQCYLCHQTTSWNDIKGVGWYKHH